MAEQGALWQWLVEALEAGEPAALLIVVASTGSSPGTRGAKLALTAESAMGTVGGGMIESELVETTRLLLVKGETSPQLLRRAHRISQSVPSSGMICGGEQTVLIYPCRQADKLLFQRLLDSCRLRTPLTISFSRQGLELLPHRATPTFCDGVDWRYSETVGQPKTAYIVGGGHVGLALAKVLDLLDFDITVIDDREGLDEPDAGRKLRLPYADIGDYIPDGPQVFVFIMTYSHHSDELVLRKLAGKPLAYLGLLGSRHKIACLKQALAGQMPEASLQTLHAPMGLAIGSHTPEEIAISIAAELIQLDKPQSTAPFRGLSNF